MNYNYSLQTKSKKRVFISFDYDHDSELKRLFVNQSEFDKSPFELADWSVKEELTGNWKEKVREKIKKVSVVAVICGEHTDIATGVKQEVEIAQEEGIPYFLFKGRKEKICKKPKSAKDSDKIHDWNWDTLESLIERNK